jgi:hypothetical protein
MKKIILLPEQKSAKPKSENLQTTDVVGDCTLLGENTKTTLEKEKHKRVITNTKRWRFTEEDYATENQLNLLQSIKTIQTPNYTTHQICVLQQLNQKIAGYKSQDVLKNLYNPILFVNITRVIELLIESGLKCHYCKKDIKVLYEIVREPLQWTLDRIDNDHGHNSGNLLIACLSCNLRRKTIYHERYEMTKICTNVIKLA